jgi:hypothetical protein
VLSEEYRLQLQEMHQPDEDGNTWGATACRKVYDIVNWVENYADSQKIDISEVSILDYGSADGKFKKQAVRRRLLQEEQITNYDPGIPEYWDTPEPADFVLCCDVLEHIEPEYLDKVLQDLYRVTDGVGLFFIAMSPAKQILPDGRNAHLIVEEEPWWKEKLEQYFEIMASQVGWPKARPVDRNLMVYVQRREDED